MPGTCASSSFNCTPIKHAAPAPPLPAPPVLQGNAYELYKQQFDERYNGNRAPLGIYLHAAWLIADPT